jgi:hypothetical protein
MNFMSPRSRDKPTQNGRFAHNGAMTGRLLFDRRTCERLPGGSVEADAATSEQEAGHDVVKS